MQRNLDIREAAQNNAVMLWEIADKIGIADSSFSRKLRRELPQGEKQRIFSAIEEIAKEKPLTNHHESQRHKLHNRTQAEILN